MFRTSICTAFVVTVALGVAFAPVEAFASKEKFVRNKPHVNIGSSSMDGVSVRLEGPEGGQTTTTDANGEFRFEGLKPGAHKLFVGNLSYGDYPPDPIKLTVDYSSFPPDPVHSKKAREIVVVGLKGGEHGDWTDLDSGGNSPRGREDSMEIIAFYLPGPQEASAPATFFDIDVEDRPASASAMMPDSFLDIQIDIREYEISGSIEFLSPNLEDTLGKPEIPDRPELIERPDTPDRPTTR
jgi:hypothetical protein